MKEQKYKARRDEHLGMEKSHRDHLREEHERHEERLHMERAMHDHNGRRHKER